MVEKLKYQNFKPTSVFYYEPIMVIFLFSQKFLQSFFKLTFQLKLIFVNTETYLIIEMPFLRFAKFVAFRELRLIACSSCVQAQHLGQD